jgi:peptide/nickel transport system substrate-binding protein
MVTRKHILVVLSFVLIAAFALSACQPVVQTVEVVKTVEVDKPVEVVTTQEVTVVETQVVEVEKAAFTTPHPILGDLKVRQAMAYCTNKLELVQSVYPLITPEQQEALVMNTFIPKTQWAYAGDENITIYPFDPEKGMALLEEDGWVMDEASGYRAKNGEALSLKFTTTTAAFRQTWAAVFEQQMANCGIQIVRLHAPASWWFGDTTGLARRDFEIGAYAWVGQVDPSGRTLWACDQIPLPENGWTGQNYMGWCNPKADTGIKNATNTLIQDERKKWYTDVQAAYTEDVPAIPLFNRTETFAANAKLEGFAPTEGEEYYSYNAGDWVLPGSDTVIVGYTQEPATLYWVEDAAVAHQVLTLLGANSSKHQTTLNWDFQPYHLVENPTLESGKATNAEVEVKAGDKVMDADGTLVELAAGMKVINAAGETVEFTGDPIMMKQMTVNFEFRPDLKWPDGEALKQEDLELGWKVKCDKESGATTFTFCDQTASTSFNGLVFTRTGVPGEQDPLYFHLTDFPIFPAHRVLADGRKLGDVAPKEMLTLPETTETPWGFGPYMVKEWVKGEKIVLEAHPYWYGGTPKSPNLVVSIITPENAEAQLLGGQVDILDSTTLTGVTETLDAASKEGKVTLVVNPSATWEHADFNMFLK